MPTKISVIIPTFNRRNVIMRSVESVLSQKSKRLEYEAIVYDDGSSDGTQRLFNGLNDKRVRYYRSLVNKGVNFARNRAIERATGKYVLLLDSDDQLSQDASVKFQKHLSILEEVNFFGTCEVKSGAKMYKLDGNRKYDYKEWLEGEKISGEFVCLVERKVFEEFKFEEKRFCFESFFWNRAIRKYGVVAFDESCRLYSFDEENRVSRKLMEPSKARTRLADYERYIKLFAPDYERLGAQKSLAGVYFKAGLYAMLSHEKILARTYLRVSLKKRFSIESTLALMASHLGVGFFLILYKIALRLNRS